MRSSRSLSPFAGVPSLFTLSSGDAGPLELDQTVLDLPEQPDDGH